MLIAQVNSAFLSIEVKEVVPEVMSQYLNVEVHNSRFIFSLFLLNRIYYIFAISLTRSSVTVYLLFNAIIDKIIELIQHSI